MKLKLLKQPFADDLMLRPGNKHIPVEPVICANCKKLTSKNICRMTSGTPLDVTLTHVMDYRYGCIGYDAINKWKKL
jgi:hypothetical protein